MSRFCLACAGAALAWIVAEVAGGLFFLGLGVRLWRYEILPLFSSITSPIVWALAFLLIVPLTLLFEKAFPSARRHRAVQLLFLMATGPLVEVLLNDGFFRLVFGKPLYVYLVLPTFDGSGSLLSPFYYATLMIHVPFTERLKGVQRPAGAEALGVSENLEAR